VARYEEEVELKDTPKLVSGNRWGITMENVVNREEDRIFVHRAVEAAIRIALIASLTWWCFAIIRPFVMPVLWGVIFAVALFPTFERLKARMGGRGSLAATILTLVALAVLIVPIVVLSASMIESVQHVTKGFEDGTLKVPPPPEGVAGWPVIGDELSAAWEQASSNFQLFFERHREQLRPVWTFVVAQAAGAGGATLTFFLAIIISGLFMVKADAAVNGLEAMATRLASDQGAEMVSVSGATIRSVVQGVLGVAVIQSLASGIGMLIAGVPGAGLWAGLVLLLAIMQLPPILILLPVAIWVFSSASTLTAVVFLIFALVVSGSDAFLKPLFLGRGMAIPMPVILLGAIGGMMHSGIVGLFIGAVVLALGYQLLVGWMMDGSEEPSGATESEPESAPTPG
jgi:predicted PurR-regulated permease PerM